MYLTVSAYPDAEVVDVGVPVIYFQMNPDMGMQDGCEPEEVACPLCGDLMVVCSHIGRENLVCADCVEDENPGFLQAIGLV